MKEFLSNKKLWAIIMMVVFAGAIISRASRFFEGPMENGKKFYNIFWIVIMGIAFISNLLKFIKLSKQPVSAEQIVNDEAKQVS